MTMTTTTYCWHRRLIHVHAAKHTLEHPSQYMHNQWLTSHCQYSPRCPASLALSLRRSTDLCIDRISYAYNTWLLRVYRKRDKVLQMKDTENDSEFNGKRLSKVAAVEVIIMSKYGIWLSTLCLHIEFSRSNVSFVIGYVSWCIVVVLLWAWRGKPCEIEA